MLIIIMGIIINILSIIVLLIGLFHEFERPKDKAIFGYTVTGSMIMYIALLGFIAVYRLFVNHDFYSEILFICVISPFIIGKLVKYQTLKKYTFIQIICFTISLAALLKIF